MSQAAPLYHLQELDLEMMRSQQRLQEINATLQDETAVTEAKSIADEAESALRALQKQVKDLELEVQSNTDKAQKSEERLYSGSVRTPKEMQDLQHEIRSLKKRNAELEENLLEMMIEVDEAQTVFDSADSALHEVSASMDGQFAELRSEKSSLENRMQELQQEREAAASNLDDDALSLYNRLKKQKRNQPVALLDDQTCSLCGVQQYSTSVQKIRWSDDIVYCHNCGRILYAK